ncbi:hypothetical protein PIB30_104990, partial [Stylosanthes scabra]|nr:hypothetical protein [Stylosanthes scabra]
PGGGEDKGSSEDCQKNRGRKRRCTICRRPGHTKRHCRSGPCEGLDAGSLNNKAESELASNGCSLAATCPDPIARGLKRKGREGVRGDMGCQKSVANVEGTRNKI